MAGFGCLGNAARFRNADEQCERNEIGEHGVGNVRGCVDYGLPAFVRPITPAPD
jgi:hypothetical protein